MHWILQNDIFNEVAWSNFLETLERFKLPHSVHKVVPFVGELEPTPPRMTNVICFGSYSMRHYAKRQGWTPGVFDMIDCTFKEQVAVWGDLMLNADSQVCKFKHVLWHDDEPRFVRPIEDSKHFAGKLFERLEFQEWQYKLCDLKLDIGISLTEDTLCQVAAPKQIYAEYRCWVVKGKIVTMSLYKRGTKVIYQNCDDHNGDQARWFAEGCISNELPAYLPDAYVIDVCETPDGWKIVELNTLNSCGFYAADLQKLVMALEDNFG